MRRCVGIDLFPCGVLIRSRGGIESQPFLKIVQRLKPQRGFEQRFALLRRERLHLAANAVWQRSALPRQQAEQQTETFLRPTAFFGISFDRCDVGHLEFLFKVIQFELPLISLTLNSTSTSRLRCPG